jgi:hypothetical protein
MPLKKLKSTNLKPSNKIISESKKERSPELKEKKMKN